MQPTVVQQLLSQYPPGSAVHRAVEFGIDLTLNLENLKLTPTERIRKAQRFLASVVSLRNEVRKSKLRASHH
jgi:hypothetical protein